MNLKYFTHNMQIQFISDGCHIEIRPSASDAVDYFNYKGWYSMVLLALVHYRYSFLNINVGAPGRCNDCQMFEKTDLKRICKTLCLKRMRKNFVTLMSQL
uniref:DDE Tnp4 domain-containing protein n=1 Tax=Bactrocera latifrons TaxID=174628 RepID=A0A0K8UBK9_BACLA